MLVTCLHTHKLTEVPSAPQIMPTNQYKLERDNTVKLARAILNGVTNATKQPMSKWLETSDKGNRYATNNNWFKPKGPGKQNI